MKDETNKNGWTKCVTIIHTMCQANSTRPPKVLKRVQSYLVLHLHARRRLATNKQNARAQRRSSSHGNNHCPDLLKIKTIKLCGKIRKTPKELLIRGNCRYLNSFVLSVCFSFCLKLHSRTEKTRQAQGKQHPQRFKSTSRIHAHKKQGTASAKDRSLFRVTFQRLTLYARRNGDK